MAIHFNIERSGRKFRARPDDGDSFLVGFETSYTDRSTGETFEGLFNVPTRELPKLLYKADDARPVFGFWADFIEPTARCEGGNFLTLNTYDRAKFTWGFGQFGAHVPDGDFIHFFRDLLDRPESTDYFPNLRVKSGRIVKVEGDNLIPMEDAQSTKPLMDYLNPTARAIEDAEVVAAAKLIHWATNVADARNLQVLHMVGVFKRLMREADGRLGLDGKTADIGLVICDIRHQGRAKFAVMQAALGSSNPLGSLLELGAHAYADRIRTLKREVRDRSALLNAKRWSRSSGDFV
jgi:hypothetical protein